MLILLTIFLLSILITLSIIDIKYGFLLDQITLPTLWIGLLLSTLSLTISPRDAILGAAMGYLIPWFLNYGIKLIRNTEGMGYGDFKMFAMLGAWMGPSIIITVMALSSFSALITAGILLIRRKISLKTRIPFGPFIALAGSIILVLNIHWRIIC